MFTTIDVQIWKAFAPITYTWQFICPGGQQIESTPSPAQLHYWDPLFPSFVSCFWWAALPSSTCEAEEGRPKHLFGGQDPITALLSKQIELEFLINKTILCLRQISREINLCSYLNSLVTLTGQTRKIYRWEGKERFIVEQLWNN